MNNEQMTRSYLNDLSKEELVQIVIDMMAQQEEMRKELDEKSGIIR